MPNTTNHLKSRWPIAESCRSEAVMLDGGCGGAIVSNPISAKSTTYQKLKLIRLFRILRQPIFWVVFALATALKLLYAFIIKKVKTSSHVIQPLHSGGAIIENDLTDQATSDQEVEGVECINSETTTDQSGRPPSCEFKEGEQIAAMRTMFWLFEYEHHGVVVDHVTTPDGREVVPLVTHWQRPYSQSQSCKDYQCECGYKGPSKDGGLVSSCEECFNRGGFVFKIQHIGNHLLSPTHKKWKDDLQPGNVLYRGYCNDKHYLGYFWRDICQGYFPVKRNDHKEKPVDKRVRFVETIKCSKDKVLKAARKKAFDLKSYNLFWNNCEHIAMLFLTGERRSFQLENCPMRIVWKIWELLCYYFQPEDASNNLDTGQSDPIPDEDQDEEVEEEESPIM